MLLAKLPSGLLANRMLPWTLKLSKTKLGEEKNSPYISQKNTHTRWHFGQFDLFSKIAMETCFRVYTSHDVQQSVTSLCSAWAACWLLARALHLLVGTGGIRHDVAGDARDPTASHRWSQVGQVIPKFWIHRSAVKWQTLAFPTSLLQLDWQRRRRAHLLQWERARPNLEHPPQYAIHHWEEIATVFY